MIMNEEVVRLWNEAALAQIKVSLRLTKHQAKQTQGRVEVKFHAFLNSVLDEEIGQLHSPADLY
jgi:hypothetical protein